MQGCRDPEPRHTALQDILGHFFDKQWDAVCALGDLVDDLPGKGRAARNLLDQGGPVVPVQTVERQHRDL